MTSEARSGRRIYFDYNATSPARPEVVESMEPFLRERFGNPSSLHFFGEECRLAVEEARASVAALVGASADEIVFTSGGTESNNIAIRGGIAARRSPSGRPHVVTSAIEHASVVRTCEALQREGVSVTFVTCGRDGVVTVEGVAAAMRTDTLLVSLMLANNETGVIQPVAEIARIARERGAVLHVDAVQAVGRMPVDLARLGADTASISAHKFCGPKGVGALYIRRGIRCMPVHTGGGHEGGLRSGTENVPAIVGFGEACRRSLGAMEVETAAVRELRDSIERGVLERVRDVEINGAGGPRLGNTISLTVRRVEGEALAMNLSALGFAVSSKSACASRADGPSHVLRAMGLDLIDAQSTIRISLGVRNTRDEVDAFLDCFPDVVERLRTLSSVRERLGR